MLIASKHFMDTLETTKNIKLIKLNKNVLNFLLGNRKEIKSRDLFCFELSSKVKYKLCNFYFLKHQKSMNFVFKNSQ